MIGWNLVWLRHNRDIHAPLCHGLMQQVLGRRSVVYISLKEAVAPPLTLFVRATAISRRVIVSRLRLTSNTTQVILTELNKILHTCKTLKNIRYVFFLSAQNHF